MSADLVWLIIRKNNSFLVKRNGIVLSREPGNLTNTHSFSASGLANPKTIDVAPVADKKNAVVVTVKKTRGVDAKPASTPNSITLSKGARGNSAALKKIAQSYRADLTKPALARVTALLRSHKAPRVHKEKKGARAAKKLAKK